MKRTAPTVWMVLSALMISSCASSFPREEALRPARPTLETEEPENEALSPLPARGDTIVSNEWYDEQVIRVRVVGDRTEITRLHRTTRITNEDPANPLDRLAGAKGKMETAIFTESELWAFEGDSAIGYERTREHRRTETGAGERARPEQVESRFNR